LQFCPSDFRTAVDIVHTEEEEPLYLIYTREIIMLITIGLFLAVVLLLIIGYIGELISSAAETENEHEYDLAIDSDPAVGTAG